MIKKCFPLFFLAGCASTSIYQSPYTYTQNSYHVLPVSTDTKVTTNYFSINHNLALINTDADFVSLMQVKWHQALKLGTSVQAYYGANFNAGLYFRSGGSYYIEQPELNQKDMFTAAAGATGGLVFTAPFSDRFEWRVVGIEGSVSKEFGRYMDFRNKSPDSLYYYSDKNSTPSTLGGFTELVFKARNGRLRFGYQFAAGSALHRIDSYYNPYDDFTPYYINNTFQFTADRYTGYFQIRTGTYYGGVQVGFTTRL
jgi:hypothetical protein